MSKKIKVLDLFSGIGGFSLGLENTGYFETAAFCEISSFPRQVLKKHWPNVPIYEDVITLNGNNFQDIGLITGGFPCQDLSATGLQKGLFGDTRSSLFRHMLRISKECGRPPILFENVPRLLSGPKENSGAWFYEFLREVAEIGYDAEWFCISAASIGAPHMRERVWIFAYPNDSQLERGGVSRRIQEKHAHFSNTCWGKDKPGVVRTSNGIPNQMDRLASLGNAVVPDIVTLIGHAIYETVKDVKKG